MDTFRAGDLTDEHVGSYLQGEGVAGVLVGFRHYDDTETQLLLDRDPLLILIPAGRPIEVLDSPPG